ncbi:hypothetical protein [Shewanella baltica]|uniref:hypothetical protein n=1 Tax=Shewanella baltica TaxID=62322 RepID=UPI000D1AA228|nr:hypothetical protein [Shewanella baltica]AVT47755.1 hypothetical protein C8I07_08370 [Shewanella baltica]
MSKYNEHSSYREKQIEHLFVGELLKRSWLEHECGLEVAKPEVDNSEYDIVAECYWGCRHIQLKSSSTTQQKIHIKLAGNSGYPALIARYLTSKYAFVKH